MGSSFSIRDRTQAPCIESAESQLLDCQQSPLEELLKTLYFEIVVGSHATVRNNRAPHMLHNVLQNYRGHCDQEIKVGATDRRGRDVRFHR